MNDKPVANPDAQDIAENSTNPVTGNVTGNDLPGDDKPGNGIWTDHTVTWDPSDAAKYGAITRNPDGSYTYRVAPDNAKVNALKDGETLTETFTYTLTDEDGETSKNTLTITINGKTDGPPSITPVDGNGTGGGTIESGHVTVNESGLTSGSAGKTANGTIGVSTLDGLGSVTIGGVTLTQAQLDTLKPGQTVTITTPYGDLILTGYTSSGNVGGVSTGGTISYTYTLKNTVDNDSVQGTTPDNYLDKIPVLVTDAGGEKSNGTIDINIVDDAPEAANDTGAVDGTTGEATGNVITGPGADKVGADGATITAISSNNSSGNSATTNPDGSLTIKGQYGTLTIKPDGSYTYERTPGSAGGKDDVFTYTLTDGDGDADTATLTISIPNGAAPSIGVPVAGASGTEVYESALDNGTVPLETTEKTSGSISFTSKDGVGSLTIHGVDVTGVVAGDSSSYVTITTAEGNELLITGYAYDPVTGTGSVTYEYTLTGSESHTGSNHEKLTDSMAVVLTDNDGESSSSDLVITIVDDSPVITNNTGNIPSLLVDESNLKEDASAFFNDLFSVNYGADGEATTGSKLSYALQLPDGAFSGLVDTASGDEVILSQVGNTISGKNSAGETVFTITIDPETGKVTLDQQRAIKHKDPTNKDEDISLLDGAIQITATATDADGDSTTSAPINIGSKFTFKDDSPSITSTENGEVNESALANGSGSDPAGKIEATGNLGVNPGADGSGKDLDTTFADVADQTALKNLQLTSAGEPLVYTVTGSGHILTATVDGKTIFTVTIENPGTANASYKFVLVGAIDHGAEAFKDLPFNFITTDGDGDQDSGSFTIKVMDDAAPATKDIGGDEEGRFTFTTSADGSDERVTVPDKGTPGGPSHGTVSIDSTGKITYIPDPDYSGSDKFTYTTLADDGVTPIETEVTVMVKPVADAPNMDGSGSSTGGDVTLPAVTTAEDTAVTLGLKAPVVTDQTDQNGSTTAGDNPERLGAITLSGIPAGTQLQYADGMPVPGQPASGDITIILTNGPQHIADLKLQHPGALLMTKEQFEGLKVLPPAEKSDDFTVKVSVTSYEVDDAGVPQDPNAGATSTATVEVIVAAVTDPVDLKIGEPGQAGSDAPYTATVLEDATINLKDYLTVTYVDNELDTTGDPTGNGGFDNVDGSQTHWFMVTGLPVGTVINGTTITSTTQEVRIEAPGLSTSAKGLPNIKVTLPPDDSGSINGITITLHVQDTDKNDKTPRDGAELQDSVTLNLQIKPVAGEVAVANVTTNEDTAVAFLAGVSVTDKSTDVGDGGREVIDSVSFIVPAGWVITAPAASVGWSVSGDGSAGSLYTITFDETLSEADREAVLDGFKIKPPAHSSADVTIDLNIKTTDTNDTQADTQTVKKSVTIAVNPVAEQVKGDTDIDGVDDLVMNVDHAYGTAGEEDHWFALGTDSTNSKGGVWAGLMAGWRNASGNEEGNQDSSEFTYALLKPELVEGATGENANGSLFRYNDGSKWVTLEFTGEAVWVPSQYLGSLQFKPAENVSGVFKIHVQAATVDYDDLTTKPEVPPAGPVSKAPGLDVAISGSADLTTITFEPVADDLTIGVSGIATGLEDTKIALSLSAKSMDPSEKVTLVISGIPVGATIHYGNGLTFTAEVGKTSLEISDFNGLNKGAVSITPPLNFGGTIPLKVEAKSDESAGKVLDTQTIEVKVTGVADDVIITSKNAKFVEADLDAVSGLVKLSDLMELGTTADTDGSETITYRISGLPDGFSLEGAALISGTATGAARVWSVSGSQFGNVKVLVPPHFSGTQILNVQGVSTESSGGGNSKTMVAIDVSLNVTPSAEAEANTGNSGLVEDTTSALGLSIVIDNKGDADEKLGAVWIQADQVETSTYTLYLNGVKLSGTPVEINGKWYIKVAAEDVSKLQVKGGENLDGKLGTFNFLYEVIDDHYKGSVTGPADTVVKSGTFTVEASAVTDAITLGLGEFSGNDLEVDGGDSVTVTKPNDVVTVNLAVGSKDTDGSEHVVRVLIEGVPDGVSVLHGEQIGPGKWVLALEKQSIGVDGATVPVQFLVSSSAGKLTDHAIKMTVQVKDRGDDVAYLEVDEDRKQAGLEWKLSTGFSGDGAAPPVIVEWVKDPNAMVSEDGVGGPYSLGGLIDAKVTVPPGSMGQTTTYTVSLTDLPQGTKIEGMTMTSVEGVPTWTATLLLDSSEKNADATALLKAFLDTLKITPPKNSNENTNPGGFNFNATLSTSAGGKPKEETIDKTEMVIPVEPVTDQASITVKADDLGEDPDPGTRIPVTFTVTPGDGIHSVIVGDVMYVTVNGTGGNAGGKLFDSAGIKLEPIESGPHAGSYAVPVTAGVPVQLEYQPPAGAKPGDVTFSATVETVEKNAPDQGPVSSSGTDTATIYLVNNGVTVDGLSQSPDDIWASGNEASESKLSSTIKLPPFSTTTVDSSETVTLVMLEGVPVGFLVYVNGVLATNAGGSDANGNTWVLAQGPLGKGDVVAILPPPFWSGKVSGMNLLVESGETSLSDKKQETLPVGVLEVKPVADGVTIAPTHSFGSENQIIGLNLNATMKDPSAAKSSQDDASLETTTVKLSGMGAYAQFFIGTDAIDPSKILYDTANGGSYTISGLSQEDIRQLGFLQAKAALDSDIKVEAWTVEDGSGLESEHVFGNIQLNLQSQKVTAGPDHLLWTGESIDGRAGSDTVQLRQGESLAGDRLGSLLKNIEVLDLTVHGANSITGLRADDVLKMTTNGKLIIKGAVDDHVQLTNAGGGWSNWATTDNGETYSSTNGGKTVTVGIAGDLTVGNGSGARASSFSMPSWDDLLSTDSGSISLDNVLPASSTQSTTLPSGAASSFSTDSTALYAPLPQSALDDELHQLGVVHY
ncbi:MAG: DUF5801 repeats-in-toxin domain-containing protein [Comamonas sp.]